MRQNRITLLAIALTVIILSALPAFSGSPIRNRPHMDIDALEMKIHDGINKERMKNGLLPLAWNPKLQPVSRKHSKDMATRDYFSHNSPEGASFSKRYEQGSFVCAVRIGNTIYQGGENIFLTHQYESITYYNGAPTYNWLDIETIAKSVVNGWMNSPGHRKNILMPYFETEALGVFIDEEGKILVTQNFC